MGSRSAETVKALEARAVVLERLRGTLKELQQRSPSLPKVPGVPRFASGGGAAGVGLWVGRALLKRSRAKKKQEAKREKRDRKALPTTAVSVKVFPSGTAIAIVAAAAIWAGVKVLEMQRRGPRPAGSVTNLRKGA